MGGANPFIGMLLPAGFGFAPPEAWLPCDGRLVSIAEYEALYTLIGTTFGGDGINNFALPDLRGRVPVGAGNGSALGERAGVENVSLTVQQTPQHSHPMYATGAAENSQIPQGNPLASGAPNDFIYSTQPPNIGMAAGIVTPSAGGSLPHGNIQPVQTLMWMICYTGIYPTPE